MQDLSQLTLCSRVAIYCLAECNSLTASASLCSARRNSIFFCSTCPLTSAHCVFASASSLISWSISCSEGLELPLWESLDLLCLRCSFFSCFSVSFSERGGEASGLSGMEIFLACFGASGNEECGSSAVEMRGLVPGVLTPSSLNTCWKGVGVSQPCEQPSFNNGGHEY